MLEVLPDNTIKLTRGDTARFTVPIRYETGEPYTVQEGDKFVFAVKMTGYDVEPRIRKEFIGGNELKLDPKDTKMLPFGEHKYDVELTTADGEVYTVINNADFILLEEVA